MRVLLMRILLNEGSKEERWVRERETWEGLLSLSAEVSLSRACWGDEMYGGCCRVAWVDEGWMR